MLSAFHSQHSNRLSDGIFHPVVTLNEVTMKSTNLLSGACHGDSSPCHTMPHIAGNVFLRISPVSPHQVLVKRWNKTDGVVSHGLDWNAVKKAVHVIKKQTKTKSKASKMTLTLLFFKFYFEKGYSLFPAYFLLGWKLIGSSLNSLIRMGIINPRSLNKWELGVVLCQQPCIHLEWLRPASVTNNDDTYN